MIQAAGDPQKEQILELKFTQVVFLVAGIYGLVVLLPQYFLEEKIGHDLPPPITQPGSLGNSLLLIIVDEGYD